MRRKNSTNHHHQNENKRLRSGAQINGGGTTFETVYDIDFSTQYNQEGFVNRTKIPTFDSNNKIINYVITKREVVVNGFTKVFKKVINLYFYPRIFF